MKAGKTMYAIIETGGKQYKVNTGDVVFIEKLDAAENDTVTFDKIVAVHTDKTFKMGAPYVKGATVEATVLKNGKGKKINILTYKPKKGYMRRKGHRQPYTKVQIGTIRATAPRAPKAAEAEAEA
jgi:large subunit ribosomal protein L21